MEPSPRKAKWQQIVEADGTIVEGMLCSNARPPLKQGQYIVDLEPEHRAALRAGAKYEDGKQRCTYDRKLDVIVVSQPTAEVIP